MQTIKKLLAFALICSLCFPFLACGSNDEDKPINPEKFVWNGDWNDPNDPNYYGGYYNPIEGDWQRLDNPNMRFIYNKDFSSSRAIYNTLTAKWEIEPIAIKYIINNTAFYERLSYIQYKIEIENDIEYLSERYLGEEWRKSKRYKE
ncbi:hypothetical protein JGH11_15335 [Dysgonomonas sp. Marseille-P4677]|uniref:hypothetical protein n=1 Tax=Dysgonomonas sp. Marseille-P4677 TaxID=2364790 RepID=UPI0019122EDF|nr:hypothetical protein [Dysgonomonas sp. Marseille-P4677]MBK5722248.1 hypothetical protein [Dysgonomonas sp. Marseille-P4677]